MPIIGLGRFFLQEKLSMPESDPPVIKPLLVKGYDDKFLAIRPNGSCAHYTVRIIGTNGQEESSLVIDEETGFQIWEWLGHTMEFFKSVELDQYKV
jgi:hypothetical protein